MTDQPYPVLDADQLMAIVLRAAIAAADVINAVYARPIESESKADGSPVTEADSAAERVIIDHLAVTGIPILAEESVAAGRIPVLGNRYFVVDPLDGTKEFIKRNGEFTVNIGLIEDGRPVLGVVLVPVTGKAYLGGPEGAFVCETAGGVVSEPMPISVRDAAPRRIVASRSHGHAALAELCETMAVGEDVSVGSSLKFCLLAEGAAQLYPRFTPTCEWDTAAGQAVLEAAGGAVIDLSGGPMRYGKVENKFLNSYFAAAISFELAHICAAEMRRLTA